MDGGPEVEMTVTSGVPVADPEYWANHPNEEPPPENRTTYEGRIWDETPEAGTYEIGVVADVWPPRSGLFAPPPRVAVQVECREMSEGLIFEPRPGNELPEAYDREFWLGFRVTYPDCEISFVNERYVAPQNPPNP